MASRDNRILFTNKELSWSAIPNTVGITSIKLRKPTRKAPDCDIPGR